MEFFNCFNVFICIYFVTVNIIQAWKHEKHVKMKLQELKQDFFNVISCLLSPCWILMMIFWVIISFCILSSLMLKRISYYIIKFLNWLCLVLSWLDKPCFLIRNISVNYWSLSYEKSKVLGPTHFPKSVFICLVIEILIWGTRLGWELTWLVSHIYK